MKHPLPFYFALLLNWPGASSSGEGRGRAIYVASRNILLHRDFEHGCHDLTNPKPILMTGPQKQSRRKLINDELYFMPIHFLSHQRQRFHSRGEARSIMLVTEEALEKCVAIPLQEG